MLQEQLTKGTDIEGADKGANLRIRIESLKKQHKDKMLQKRLTKWT